MTILIFNKVHSYQKLLYKKHIYIINIKIKIIRGMDYGQSNFD